MSKMIDITGRKFGKLTAIRKTTNAKNGRTRWLCRCEDCGNNKAMVTNSLTSGSSKSCGCMRGGKVTHGLSKTSEYCIWSGIIKRTTNPRALAFPRYGGMGISVCNRWLNFENFIEDMGRRPSKHFSIERIDNEKGYSPNNCEWATIATQNRNKRNNRHITIDGVTRIMADWIRYCSTNSNTFYRRKKRGLSDKEALGM